MTQEEIDRLAKDWIAYWYAPKDSELRIQLHWATEREYDLLDGDPETLWKLILAIHSLDQSPRIDKVLSAGPIEDLLAKHGESFIDHVEAEARRDPTFASTLGGVWKNNMTDEVWERLQAVWDRRGWDGTPKA